MHCPLRAACKLVHVSGRLGMPGPTAAHLPGAAADRPPPRTPLHGRLTCPRPSALQCKSSSVQAFKAAPSSAAAARTAVHVVAQKRVAKKQQVRGPLAAGHRASCHHNEVERRFRRPP